MPFQEAEVSTSRIDGEHTFAQGWVGVKTAKAGTKKATALLHNHANKKRLSVGS